MRRFLSHLNGLWPSGLQTRPRLLAVAFCVMAFLLGRHTFPAFSVEPEAGDSPVYLEWKQRLSQTARRSLRTEVANPFRPKETTTVPAPDETGGGETSGPLLESLAQALTGAGTATWSLGSGLPNPYLLPEGWWSDRDLGDWDWRQRLKLIREARSLFGGDPQGATLTPSVSSEIAAEGSSATHPATLDSVSGTVHP